jgi:hypothetical protein
MKFAFLGYGPENWDAMSKPQQDAMFWECFTYDNLLLKEGHFVGDGLPLQPSPSAKVLRWRKGSALITDGPYAETKEQLGGIGVLEATDMARAVELVSKHPGLNWGAMFEIRPIDEESLKRQAESIAALRPTAAATDPKSVRFASLGYVDPNGWGSTPEDERAAMLADCVAFDEARVKSGQLLSGIALYGTGTAKTLRAQAGKIAVTDGPFAETKECLGGIVVLALKDLNEGLATLSKHPALPFGVAIELRPIDEEIARRWKIQRDASQHP